jgi:hypothetical protein
LHQPGASATVRADNIEGYGMRYIALVAALALAACGQQNKAAEPPAGAATAPAAIAENLQIDGYRGATIAINGDTVTATRAAGEGPQGIRIRRLAAMTTPVRVTLAASGNEINTAVMRNGERQRPEGEGPYTVALGPGALDDVVFYSRDPAALSVTISALSDCGAAAEAACLGQTATTPAQ